MRIYDNVKQGSQEWLNLRLGMITGSRLKNAMSKDNLPLVDEMVTELVVGYPEDRYTNQAMQRGKDMEPIAREFYEEKTGQRVEQLGFCVSNSYKWLGLSPDGLILKDGRYVKGIEIKCPSTVTHYKYIRMNKLPTEYRYQVYCYFLVCQDMEEMDFVSFDDRYTIQPMFIYTIKRMDIQDELKETMDALIKFWEKFEKYFNDATSKPL